MLTEGEVNNLIWIDEAFSKDYVDELEAACCLTEGQNRVCFGDKVDGYFIDNEVHPNLRANYRVILTWRLRGYSLLIFIDKAISKNVQNLRRELLLQKCEELFLSMSPADQTRFISEYYYIAHALNLVVKSEDAIGAGKHEPLLDEEYPWVVHARKIYYELGLEKSHLNMDQRAVKVENEMNNRLSKGEKEMAKQGGRKAPASLTIRRHALINL
jgi:hypothetical protein